MHPDILSMKKLRFPLSLKVSLWLLLNLILLAGAGAALLLTRSGFSWDALVSGSAGNRLQAVASVISAQLSHESPDAHDAVLARFSEAYGVDFALVAVNGYQIAGSGSQDLPAPVRMRIADISGGPFPGFPTFPGRMPGGFPTSRGERMSPLPGKSAPDAKDLAGWPIPTPPPFIFSDPRSDENTADSRQDKMPLTPPPSNEPGATLQKSPPTNQTNARFLIRTRNPVAYWAGIRLSIPGKFPGGPILLMRAHSLGTAALLLDLKPWILGALVTLVFSILFWLPFVRGITRTLRQITQAAGLIAEGNFSARVDEHRTDELGLLGQAVNRMAARLDLLVTGQRRFLGDIAHELGSPLGRMQLGVGILEEQSPPALQAAVANVREEVQQMAALVHELLALTKANFQSRSTALASVELTPLVTNVITRENASGFVSVDIPAQLAVRADPDLLARALGNLVRNSLRYARPDAASAKITIKASLSPSDATNLSLQLNVLLLVEDEGPGVPPEALARLGEPFYRPESARTRETGGVGLGLAIVHRAVEACQGTVHFANRSPHGFRAEIRLAQADFTHS